jgi:tRNA A37 threonylcarbamoyladenosine biosynthesis protein TsaE
MIRHILRKYMDDPTLVVRSPTYTYYQKYSKEIVGTQEIGDREETKKNLPPTSSSLSPVYHMDLYRLEDYETWVSIGGEEIAEDPTTIMLIEWPEILGDSVQYTQKISIELVENGEREVVMEKVLRK